jgi:TonB family protein
MRLHLEGTMRLSAAKWVLPAIVFAASSVVAQRPCTINPGTIPNGSYEVKDDVTAPSPVFTTDPEYPSWASTAGLQGKVRLLVFLDCAGTPATVRLYASNEKPPELGRLGKAALDTARHWKFQPATLRGEPVLVRFDVEFTFKLEEPTAATPRRGSVTHSFIYTTRISHGTTTSN